MDLDTLIITSFCEIDDMVNTLLAQLPKARLRQRGPQPTLHDSEVLCMEVIGAYLGLECDSAIYHYFRRHYAHFFPALPKLHDSEVLCMEVIGAYLGLECDSAIYHYFRRHYAHFFPALPKLHRTTFTRQATNLCHLKERLWQHWLGTTPQRRDFGLNFGLIDSLPLPVCRFARATFCHRFRYEDSQQLRATYGYDHVARQTFWGLRLHLHVAWPGLITGLTVAPAHQADVTVAPQLLHGQAGITLGDRNYCSPQLQEHLCQSAPNLKLLTPYKNKKRDPAPTASRLLCHFRYRIETVFSQLCGRLRCRQVGARDVWHLVNRLLRVVLCHTLCFKLNVQCGNPPLQLAKLLQ
ncbi:MAG: IS982 family transposase [Acidobacteria bacterium]|nr:IS982 family transposase [Acidobacteriota bacterium]